MTGPELVIVAAIGGGIAVVTKMSNRRKSTPNDGKGRVPKAGSLLVKAYSSSGATPLNSTTLSEAAAELAGRGAGRGLRAIRRASTAANQRMAANHTVRRARWEGRWKQRAAHRPAGSVIDKWRAVGDQAKSHPRVRHSVDRIRHRFRRRPPAPTAPDQPTAPAPRPQQAAPAAAAAQPARSPRTTPSGGPTMTATTDAPQTAAEDAVAPLDWQVMIDRIRNYNPESDADLLEFMKAEAAGMVAYAEALEEARETCVTDIGLDPTAVQGITAYSEQVSEAAARMSDAMTQFVTVYGQVLELAASGVVMPHNGRFFTGES